MVCCEELTQGHGNAQMNTITAYTVSGAGSEQIKNVVCVPAADLCVCVRVCERERERVRAPQFLSHPDSFFYFLLSIKDWWRREKWGKAEPRLNVTSLFGDWRGG